MDARPSERVLKRSRYPRSMSYLAAAAVADVAVRFGEGAYQAVCRKRMHPKFQGRRLDCVVQALDVFSWAIVRSKMASRGGVRQRSDDQECGASWNKRRS